MARASRGTTACTSWRWPRPRCGTSSWTARAVAAASSAAVATLRSRSTRRTKSITRPLVTLGTWNANFHDHALEIATGRVQVRDMPPEEAKKVADLVATTDGIIFHLWPIGDRIPTGSVEIGQAVGHTPISATEYARGRSK